MNKWLKKAQYAWALPLLLLSGSALAQTRVVVTDTTDIFAGPGFQYPTVGRVQWGSSLILYGCLRDYAWCDVSTGYDRGWVDADDLSVTRSGRNYTLYGSRDWYSYPIVTFMFGSYWDNYYRNRAWYGDRNRYQNWQWQNNARPWHGPRPGVRPPPGRPPYDGSNLHQPRPPYHNGSYQPPRPPHFDGNRPPYQGGNRPDQPPRPPHFDGNRPGPNRPDFGNRPDRPHQEPRPRPPMTGGDIRPGVSPQNRPNNPPQNRPSARPPSGNPRNDNRPPQQQQ